MVHVVIGRPGVILLGEGQPQRVRSLIGQEKRRLAKVIGNAPLYDYMVGTGEGELSIRKLRTTFMKLPRNLTGKDVNALDKRLGRADGPAADAEGRDPEEHAPVARASSASSAPARPREPRSPPSRPPGRAGRGRYCVHDHRRDRAGPAVPPAAAPLRRPIAPPSTDRDAADAGQRHARRLSEEADEERCSARSAPAPAATRPPAGRRRSWPTTRHNAQSISSAANRRPKFARYEPRRVERRGVSFARAATRSRAVPV